MSTKNVLNGIVVLMIAVLALSACAPQAGGAPTATSVPAPTPGSETAAAHFEGLSSGLDNATQARIRTVSMVMGAPDTDVYVNGMPAFNGGVAQQKIQAGHFGGWLYVAPGTYSIALVPHGEAPDQALFSPTDVKVEAGHRYTVAAVGQLADKDVHPLVVDETTLEAGLGAGITDNITIDINNMKGADSVTEEAYGKTAAEKIKYGEARAYAIASGSPQFAALANKDGTTKVLWEDTGWAEPGTSFALPLFGPYPADNYDSVGNVSQGTSELNVVDFLAGFEGRGVKIDGHPATFKTLLGIVDKAGLRNQLVNEGPYFLLAPTDAAFEALPQAEREALLNDPQALMNLLHAHMVDGYFPRGSLSGAVYDYSYRTLTSRLGKALAFDGETLNGRPIGPNYSVGNGNRVQIVYDLLPYK
jgi:uncharacterized surface protein with fasciclin (FAS1) repeats